MHPESVVNNSVADGTSSRWWNVRCWERRHSITVTEDYHAKASLSVTETRRQHASDCHRKTPRPEKLSDEISRLVSTSRKVYYRRVKRFSRTL